MSAVILGVTMLEISEAATTLTFACPNVRREIGRRLPLLIAMPPSIDGAIVHRERVTK
jgi:hypothetical protein